MPIESAVEYAWPSGANDGQISIAHYRLSTDDDSGLTLKSVDHLLSLRGAECVQTLLPCNAKPPCPVVDTVSSNAGRVGCSACTAMMLKLQAASLHLRESISMFTTED